MLHLQTLIGKTQQVENQNMTTCFTDTGKGRGESSFWWIKQNNVFHYMENLKCKINDYRIRVVASIFHNHKTEILNYTHFGP